MGLFRKSRPSSGGGPVTKLFFATDLHSSEACFRKLLATPRVYEVDTLIMGGDCTGKMLIPLVEDGAGGHTCQWGGERHQLSTPEALADQERQIRYAGLYPIRVSAEEAVALEQDPDRLARLFTQRMLQTLGDWVALAEERLGDSDVHVIMTPGNDEEFSVDDVLRASPFVDAAEDRVTRVGGHEMLSVGWSNHTPWDTPRECSEEELAVRIDRLAEQVEDMGTAIFNIHVPPYGTGLDDAPKLDADLKPVQGGSVMTPVGSTAVRDAIARHQPLLSLHGHIHESRGMQKLGRTVCINPGSSYSDWTLQGVIVDLEDKEVTRYVPTTG